MAGAGAYAVDLVLTMRQSPKQSLRPGRRIVAHHLFAATFPGIASIALVSGILLTYFFSGLTAFLLSCPPAAAEGDGPKSGSVSMHRPRIGLALGGGGVRAAAHVGVLKVLEEEGIPVDMIVGSSTGAFVGGLYSAGMTPMHIEEQFTKKKFMHAFLTLPLAVRVLVIPLFYTPKLIGFDSYDGLYKGKKFAAYLNKQLPQTERNIEDLRIPFGAVAVNLLDGQSDTIRTGNLGQALQASCAIPALRKPVKLGKALYIDGGVLDNLPVQETKKLGADLVVAVDIDEKVVPIEEPVFKKFGSVAHRVMTMHYAVVDQDQQAMADYIIHPDVTGVGLISTDAADAKRCVEAGESAARRAVPRIRELMERMSRQ